ncbi:MAG: hypothetical protein ACD_36C00088G0004, partial [uncultured bacterium]
MRAKICTPSRYLNKTYFRTTRGAFLFGVYLKML